MSKFVAAYDVADDKQRTRIGRAVAAYGTRIQKSVFIVELNPSDVVELRAAIGPLLSAEDSFDLIPMDNSPKRPHLRWQVEQENLEPVLVVD